MLKISCSQVLTSNRFLSWLELQILQWFLNCAGMNSFWLTYLRYFLFDWFNILFWIDKRKHLFSPWSQHHLLSWMKAKKGLSTHFRTVDSMEEYFAWLLLSIASKKCCLNKKVVEYFTFSRLKHNMRFCYWETRLHFWFGWGPILACFSFPFRICKIFASIFFLNLGIMLSWMKASEIKVWTSLQSILFVEDFSGLLSSSFIEHFFPILKRNNWKDLTSSQFRSNISFCTNTCRGFWHSLLSVNLICVDNFDEISLSTGYPQPLLGLGFDLDWLFSLNVLWRWLVYHSLNGNRTFLGGLFKHLFCPGKIALDWISIFEGHDIIIFKVWAIITLGNMFHFCFFWVITCTAEVMGQITGHFLGTIKRQGVLLNLDTDLYRS